MPTSHISDIATQSHSEQRTRATLTWLSNATVHGDGHVGCVRDIKVVIRTPDDVATAIGRLNGEALGGRPLTLCLDRLQPPRY